MARNQIRQSQLVLSFGPGSMLDLPDVSVLISGLEDWHYSTDERSRCVVSEPRLTAKLEQRFKVPRIDLRRPPRATDSQQQVDSNVRASEFPTWFVAAIDEKTERGFFRRRIVKKSELEGGKFRHAGKNHGVVPVRFVKACVRGHLGDIDWKWLLHGAGSDCVAPKWIEERGNTGDLTEVYVTCECGKYVRMSDVAAEGAHRLGRCMGDRPWLGPNTREECTEHSKLLIRNATNAYFPERLTVISIPAGSVGPDAQVSCVLTALDPLAQMRHGLQFARMGEPLRSALEGLTDADVWAAYDRIKSGIKPNAKSVKDEEYEALSNAAKQQGTDKPGGDFYAREHDLGPKRERWMSPIKRVVLLHRLRAVTALVGFTRFEPGGTDIHGELDAGVKTAAIARDVKWLPATESRGEGVFIELDADLVRQWLARPEVQQRTDLLIAGFEAWRREHADSNRKFSGTAYILLHTLSHMLMASIALECGYPASSLQERIYVVGDQSAGAARYGLMIYTAANDAEGTLGGLVQAGRNIERHLRHALESTTLCSNDPVCAQHDPTSSGTEHLNAAACHGCVIAPETSCEQRNEALDRALVVPTVDSMDVAFFRDCMP